jgi:hypothetical protein
MVITRRQLEAVERGYSWAVSVKKQDLAQTIRAFLEIVERMAEMETQCSIRREAEILLRDFDKLTAAINNRGKRGGRPKI